MSHKDQIKSCKAHLYADDLQLYIEAELNKIEFATNLINEDLNNISLWSEKNYIKLNPTKSQAIFIYKKSVNTNLFPPIFLGCDIIEYFEKVRDLGIILNNRLTWDDHISNMSQKIYGSLRSLWDVTRFANSSLRKKLFLAFVFPLFLYGDVVFFGMSKACERKIQLLLNACVRYIFKLRKYDHISEYSNTVLNCNLNCYYKIRVLCQFFKIISSHTPTYLFDKLKFSLSNRNTANLIIPINRSNHLNYSFFVKGATLWNMLPTNIKNSNSVKIFKQNCLEYFNNNL